MPFTPTLPEGMSLAKGSSINVEHEDYKRLVSLAEKEGLTQKQFSAALGYELERHTRAAAGPKPTPAPKPALPENWAKMSDREKFAYAFANPPTQTRP
jgi:hypothetical protein